MTNRQTKPQEFFTPNYRITPYPKEMPLQMQYALLTNQPFVRPVHSGHLVIPAATTASMATAMKEAHIEQICLFCEVQGVEKAFIQQIVQAVDAPYLMALRERSSNSLWGTGQCPGGSLNDSCHSNP
jgi:hypothetical protein